jgi:hypothetical protein
MPMKKWILRIIFLLIVLTIAGFFFAKSYLTRDYLVAAIEKSINSRIQVKDIDVNLYGFSGTVDLNDVIITERDDLASEKIPHDKRDPIENGDIHLDSVTFDISIWEILSKKILVEKIDFDGVTLNLTLYENGDTSIEKLFAKPRSERDEIEKPKKFNAKENEKFITTINEINLTNVDLNLIVEKTQLMVKGRGVYLNLLDINVNPKQLDTVNNAKIKVGGTFDLQSLDSKQDYGKIISSGESDFTLFNGENGDLEPDMVISLTVDSESYLTSRVPALSKIWKTADMLNKFGIKSLRIPEKAKFKNDQSVRVAYKLGVSTLLDPLIIKVNDWELQALAQSWIGSGNNMHMLGVKLRVGEAISNKLGGLLAKSSAASSILGKLTGGSGADSWLENGKFTLHVESSGELSNPKVTIKNKLALPAGNLIESLLNGSAGDKEDSLEKSAKDLLKGLFN